MFKLQLIILSIKDAKINYKRLQKIRIYGDVLNNNLSNMIIDLDDKYHLKYKIYRFTRKKDKKACSLEK